VTRFWPNVTRYSQPINKPTTIFIPSTSKSSQILQKFPQNPNLRNSYPFPSKIFIFSSSIHQTNSINLLHHHQPIQKSSSPSKFHQSITLTFIFNLTLTMVETRNKGKTQTQPTKKAKIVPKRKQLVKPNPNAAPPPSVNHRFYNDAARDRFKDIRHYRVIQKRGFDFPKLISNPEFFQVFTERGWESLNSMIF